jgi:hypothetical protein
MHAHRRPIDAAKIAENEALSKGEPSRWHCNDAVTDLLIPSDRHETEARAFGIDETIRPGERPGTRGFGWFGDLASIHPILAGCFADVSRRRDVPPFVATGVGGAGVEGRPGIDVFLRQVVMITRASRESRPRHDNRGGVGAKEMRLSGVG